MDVSLALVEAFDSIANYLHTSSELNAQVFWLDLFQKEIESDCGGFMALGKQIVRIFFWIALPIQAMEVDRVPKSIQSELDARQRPVQVVRGHLQYAGRALQSLERGFMERLPIMKT